MIPAHPVQPAEVCDEKEDPVDIDVCADGTGRLPGVQQVTEGALDGVVAVGDMVLQRRRLKRRQDAALDLGVVDHSVEPVTQGFHRLVFRQQSGSSGHEFFGIAPVDLGEERFAVGKVPGERSPSYTGAFGDLVEVDVVELGKGCAGGLPGWSVHAERRQGAVNRLYSVGFQGGSLLDESCGEAGADAAGHSEGEARDMAHPPVG